MTCGARGSCLLIATVSHLSCMPKDACLLLWHLPFSHSELVTLPKCFFDTYFCWSSSPWPETRGMATHDHHVNLGLVTPLRLKTYSCTRGGRLTVGSVWLIQRLQSAPAFGFRFIGYPSSGWMFNPGSAASQHTPSSQTQKRKVDLAHASARLQLEWIPEVIQGGSVCLLSPSMHGIRC